MIGSRGWPSFSNITLPPSMGEGWEGVMFRARQIET
jgi:hypothetical protein